MKKFKALFKFPCNLNCNSPQAIEYSKATPDTHPEAFGETLLCIVEERLFRKQPKHYTGVINLRVKGGKWEEVPLKAGLTITDYLEKINATSAHFRGAPRVK